MVLIGTKVTPQAIEKLKQAIDLYQNVVKVARPELAYYSPSEMVWKMVRSSWKPSGRRPYTLRDMLSLAGARKEIPEVAFTIRLYQTTFFY